MCVAWFNGAKIVIRDPLDITKLKITKRKYDEFNDQYHATEILEKLKYDVPKKAFCMICIMMQDIYPFPESKFGKICIKFN